MYHGNQLTESCSYVTNDFLDGPQGELKSAEELPSSSRFIGINPSKKTKWKFFSSTTVHKPKPIRILVAPKPQADIEVNCF
jgi:hypothetical protein